MTINYCIERKSTGRFYKGFLDVAFESNKRRAIKEAEKEARQSGLMTRVKIYSTGERIAEFGGEK